MREDVLVPRSGARLVVERCTEGKGGAVGSEQRCREEAGGVG